jgi:hypothetical protein
LTESNPCAAKSKSKGGRRYNTASQLGGDRSMQSLQVQVLAARCHSCNSVNCES